MSHQQLARMANDIAAYFATEPDRERAIAGIEQHLRRFWEPRMRHRLIALCAAGEGELDPLAAAAVARLAADQPPA